MKVPTIHYTATSGKSNEFYLAVASIASVGMSSIITGESIWHDCVGALATLSSTNFILGDCRWKMFINYNFICVFIESSGGFSTTFYMLISYSWLRKANFLFNNPVT